MCFMEENSIRPLGELNYPAILNERVSIKGSWLLKANALVTPEVDACLFVARANVEFGCFSPFDVCVIYETGINDIQHELRFVLAKKWDEGFELDTQPVSTDKCRE
ncbi:hypothetical protein TNCT_174321 [Trichonephila clavata]|uniref:Uncharacterized protein n=1 Tax=Trichonephila clavata TaxID=2740835 RepID=A0A8X6LET8_TRICU|nr:hypothetical protein TNCT_174321 [Trichonephila clavata]